MFARSVPVYISMGDTVLVPTQGIAGLILFEALREVYFPSCGLCARIFMAKFVTGS